mgnify:CR=1 FL=1
MKTSNVSKGEDMTAPIDSNEPLFLLVRMKLRQYYNEVIEITEDEDLSVGESEKALMLLDDKYAKIITELL